MIKSLENIVSVEKSGFVSHTKHTTETTNNIAEDGVPNEPLIFGCCGLGSAGL